MKKILKRALPILLVLISLQFGISSCEKFNPIADVRILTCQIQSDGSVKLVGIVTKGNKEISEIGFCFDDEGSPTYEKSKWDRIQCSLKGDLFSTVLPSIYFDTSKKYYFRAFVWSQGLNLMQSDIVPLYKITAEPVTPACFPTNNFINIGMMENEVFDDIDVPDVGSDQVIRANSNSFMFNFKFDFRPKTGIYTTVSSDPYGENQVQIYFYTGAITATLEPGSSVYVNEVYPGKYEITLCEAPWKLNTSTRYVTAKVVTP